jgi:hypothetical protein
MRQPAKRINHDKQEFSFMETLIQHLLDGDQAQAILEVKKLRTDSCSPRQRRNRQWLWASAAELCRWVRCCPIVSNQFGT